jgi:hypothetical protein
MGNSRLWRIDPKADYSPLNGVSRHRINADLILQHWDDLLRLAGSLKLGLVQATSIMRTLQVGDRPTKLAEGLHLRSQKLVELKSLLDQDAIPLFQDRGSPYYKVKVLSIQGNFCLDTRGRRFLIPEIACSGSLMAVLKVALLAFHGRYRSVN